jgi:hypothetical protein
MNIFLAAVTANLGPQPCQHIEDGRFARTAMADQTYFHSANFSPQD